MSYRDRLFSEYHHTHVGHLDRDNAERARWFEMHVSENYIPHLPEPESRPKILEIGCNKGYMLAALRDRGYENLTGLDLSGEDLEIAKRLFDLDDLRLEDAQTHLRDHQREYDIVLMKAVLEHVPKDEVVGFLEDIKAGLTPGGRALIEVPNMDWFFAQHERYMDFTHEVGFTRESFSQVLRLVYGTGEVHPIRQVEARSARVRMQRKILLPILRKVGTLVLETLGDGGNLTLWYTRSILGVAGPVAGADKA